MPSGHVKGGAHGSATQLPATHTCPAAAQPVRAHPPATHWPPEQPAPAPQVTAAQGSTHWFDRQTVPGALHAVALAPHGIAVQLPLVRHWKPAGHRAFSLLHAPGRQTPFWQA
ncbi:MAG TPA: hypothetical protein VF832_15690 [Longimicrobiales bacterium]